MVHIRMTEARTAVVRTAVKTAVVRTAEARTQMAMPRMSTVWAVVTGTFRSVIWPGDAVFATLMCVLSVWRKTLFDFIPRSLPN